MENRGAALLAAQSGDIRLRVAATTAPDSAHETSVPNGLLPLGNSSIGIHISGLLLPLLR